LTQQPTTNHDRLGKCAACELQTVGRYNCYTPFLGPVQCIQSIAKQRTPVKWKYAIYGFPVWSASAKAWVRWGRKI